MIKVKNVRPGVVIIADAKLKLAPGETTEIDVPTKQTQQALAEGLLAKVETEADSRSRARTTPKANTPKEDTKPETKPDAKVETKVDTKAEAAPTGKPGDSAKPPAETPNAAG